VNNIQIDGNIGTENKGKFTLFSVAMYAGKDRDTDEKQTKWFNCICFNEVEFGRGAKVRVTGRIDIQMYQGEAREQIIVDEIISYDPWSKNNERENQANAETAGAEEIDLGSDVPF